MTDLITKVKELERNHRKKPETPRAWADSIIKLLYKLDDVPEHLRGIVSDHIQTHEMLVDAKARAILALRNGQERLEAFKRLTTALQEPVRLRVHEIRNEGKGISNS